MSRGICLVLLFGSLLSAPGCTSCGGLNSSCRRPSFMEFRSPCGRGGPAPMMAAPMAPACGAPACGAPACSPACDPCGGAAPGCGDCGTTIMSSPDSMPVISDGGTFS